MLLHFKMVWFKLRGFRSLFPPVLFWNSVWLSPLRPPPTPPYPLFLQGKTIWPSLWFPTFLSFFLVFFLSFFHNSTTAATIWPKGSLTPQVVQGFSPHFTTTPTPLGGALKLARVCASVFTEPHFFLYFAVFPLHLELICECFESPPTPPSPSFPPHFLFFSSFSLSSCSTSRPPLPALSSPIFFFLLFLALLLRLLYLCLPLFLLHSLLPPLPSSPASHLAPCSCQPVLSHSIIRQGGCWKQKKEHWGNWKRAESNNSIRKGDVRKGLWSHLT